MKKSILCNFYKLTYAEGLIMWYESGTDEVVCMIKSGMENGRMWISSVYVSPDYRKRGLCKAMLDYVVFTEGCERIAVRKNNERALQIYKKYGFETYAQDGEWLYMSLEGETE